MKFAMYHPWIHLKSGLERHILEIMRRSGHDWTLYTSYFEPSQTFEEFADVHVVEIAPRALPLGGPVRTLASALSVTRARLPHSADATLFGLNGISDLALFHAKSPVVGLCFTPVKAMHDPTVIAALRTAKPAKYVTAQLLAPPFGTVDRALWRRLDRVIANSHETHRRIERAELAPADRVDVIHPGVDTDLYVPAATFKPGQLLAAGRISWHKNLELAVDTMRELHRAGTQARLVVAGGVAESDESYLDEIRKRATSLPVDFIINPSDEELRSLYRDSDALLFTARNEDFGLVPLEAMASGTPVISVDSGGPRETIQHGVGGWLIPPTPQAFAAQAQTLLASDDPHPQRVAARQRAEQFSWQSCASRVDRVMEDAAATANPPRRRG